MFILLCYVTLCYVPERVCFATRLLQLRPDAITAKDMEGGAEPRGVTMCMCHVCCVTAVLWYINDLKFVCCTLSHKVIYFFLSHSLSP